MRKAVIATAAGAAVLVASASTAVALTLTGGHPAAVTGPAQVAALMSATGFTDCGPHPLGGVSGSGTAYLAGARIGIDTFAGPAQRDSWLQVSADFGIVPLRQGANWVAYKATDQTAKGCE